MSIRNRSYRVGDKQRSSLKSPFSDDTIISQFSCRHYLVYSKNIAYVSAFLIERPDEEKGKFAEEDEFLQERGRFYVRPLKSNLAPRPTLVYPIKTPDGKSITTQWICAESTFIAMKNEGRVVIRKKQDGEYQVYKKYYENDGDGKILFPSIIDFTNNNEGKEELKALFNVYQTRDLPFDTPKPTALIRSLITIASNPGDIILDFFSGSATTAHAVMQLNSEDDGNRKYIMVQLPEPTNAQSEAHKTGYPTIADIGKERIRRAGDLVKQQALEAWNAADMEQRQQMKNPDELDIGFKVFKLDSTNLIKWSPDRENLEASLLGYVDNLEPGRTEEDLLYEVMLKMGADLTWPIEANKVGSQTIYSVGFGALMVCLSDHITTEVADAMVRLKDEMKPETWKVVFKDSGFADDMAKTNIKETLKCAGLPEDAFTTL